MTIVTVMMYGCGLVRFECRLYHDVCVSNLIPGKLAHGFSEKSTSVGSLQNCYRQALDRRIR
jgi:hypothetical protein